MSKFYLSASAVLLAFLLMFTTSDGLHANSEHSQERGFFISQMRLLQKALIQNFPQELISNSTFESLPALPSSMAAMMTECLGGSGNLGGTAFGDFNYDGVEDGGTVGIPNVDVHLFAPTGINGASVLTNSTTTDEFGHYTFSGLTDGTQYRVEFHLPTYLSSLKQYTEGGSDGTNNTTGTQMAMVPNCDIDAGFAFSEDFYGDNPYMGATCFVNGNPNPVNPPADDAQNSSFEKTVVWFRWNSTGSTNSPLELANAGETGSVYGMAFNRFTQKIYTSAFIKRHTGLGPLGLGGIYEIDVTDINTPIVTPFLDVASIGINVGNIGDNVARGLPDMLNEPSNDASAFDKVAKEGIGAIAVDEIKNTLYFVNLFDKTLYRIALDSDNNPATAPTVADVTSFVLPATPCNNGEFRPFSVNIHRGEVYVGGNCDGTAGGTAADLVAYVYQLTGVTFTEIATANLDYVKGYAANENSCDNFPGWYPWQSTIPATCSGSGSETLVYPTPVLSDFQFDADGSLILGFMDRMGHQIGYRNWPLTGDFPLLSNVSGGDILRLYNNQGTFEQEMNGTAGPLTSAGAGNAQGLGGGEFYFMDLFSGPSDNIPFPPHIETSQGDLALFPGSNQVATTSLDPYSTLFNSGGVNWMNNENGEARPEGYVLYRSSTSDISTFSKGNGLGGLISLGESAPAEVGGVVWNDTNTDGIQDGNEGILANINVSLYTAAGVQVATTMTNANGTYSFGGADLNYNTDYYLVFGEGGQFDTTDGSLNDNMFVTVANTGMFTDPDRNDSDITNTPPGVAGNAFTTFPSIAFTTGAEGWVSHDMDAGFTGDNLNPIAGVGGNIFSDNDGDGIQDGVANGEGGVQGVTITLFDDNDMVVATVVTDVDGNYYFSNIVAGTYYINVDASTNDAGLNYEFSAMDVGNDDAIDSDINPTTMNSDPITFDPGNGDIDIDGGLAAPVGTVDGFVFNDLDMNGIQGGAETGISNVTVLLYEDGNTIPVQSVVTDASGNYTFIDVPAGNYFIDFDATTNDAGLTNLSGSPMDAGNDDAIDSDADANAGETNVFNYNPAVNPIADFDAGFFQPTGTISGSSFSDNNGDGIQNAGDTPFEGVTITLFDDNGIVVATTVTDMNGDYAFTDVIAGNYTISFDETTNVDGSMELNPTAQDQGEDDSLDSDISSNGTLVITNFDPMTPVNIDAGFVQAMTSISGTVFNDVNENGIQEAAEPTVNGVTVTLFDENDMVIATTTTTGNGDYIFAGIPSGNYYIGFNPSTAGITDFMYTAQNQGGDTSVDSDVNISGTTAIFTVDALTPTPVDNISAGVIFAGGNIMGFAWKDCNDGIFATGEERLAGVPVALAGQDMAGNSVSDNTTTDATGAYSFMSLPQGNYTLAFSIPTAPTGLAYVIANQGNNELIDSDANISTGSTPSFALAAGQTIEDYSVGFRDNENPVFLNPPADEDVSCGDPNFGNPPTLTATDNCDTDVDITFSETMDTATGGCSGITITRTWVATDDCGNSTTHTQTLNATDNTAPTITIVNPDLIGLMDGDTIFFSCNDDIPVYGVDDVEATDVCDPDPEVVFEDFLITVGNCAENGFLQQMYCGWIATDNCGNMDTLEIYIVISDDEAPVFMGTVPADITITCADEIPDAPVITATDNCVEDILVTFDETMIGDSCDLVKITRKYTAIDDCGNMTMEQYNIYIETPELEIFGVPTDVTLACEDLTDIPIVTYSHDCHGLDTLYEEVIIGDICEDYKIIRKWTAMNDCGQMAMEQYTIDVVVDEVEISGVPADVTVDCDNIPDAATPTVNDACYAIELEFSEVVLNSICDTYQISRTWIATDECGNMTSETQIITVEIEPLGLTGVPADITIDCTDAVPPIANPQPTSDCYEVTIDYGETVIGDICSNYKILRVWVANDFCGNQIMQMQTIVVEVPELELTNLAPDLTLECDENIPTPMDPIPTTDCYEIEIEFEETINAGACATEFTIERNWSATDECGNVVTHEQLITVIDTTGPVITVVHPDLVGLPSGSTLTYDCSELVNLMDAPATAIDNCVDEPLEVNFMEMTEIGDCATDGFILRLECCWKAEDPCGNQSEYCVTVVITDTEAPILSGVPSDVTINLANGDTVPPVADVTATDACADPELSFIETQDALDCGYVITRTWLAEDDCGNSVFQSQIITVNDICDCPDIVLDEVIIINSDCNNDNGSITVTTELSENIYDFILLPNYGNQNEVGNVVTDLPPGSYLMIVNLPNVEECDEKIYFNIEESGCSDEINITLPDGQTDYCIDESVFNIEGTITSSSFCNAGSASTVLASNLDDNCMTLTAADGFEGLSPDQICVINCFNGSTTDCDTTYLNITVTPIAPQPCALALSNIQTANDLCGFGIGSVEFSVVGGEGPFVFNWTDGVSDNVIATGLLAGTYFVTVTDNGTDCELSESFTITDEQLLPLQNSDANVSDATCNGASDGQITSTTGTTYNVYTATNILVGTTPLSGLPAGNYIVTEESGNCTANLSVFINEPTAIVITPTITDEGCDGGDGNITLAVSGGIGNLTYFWSPNVSSNAIANNLFAGNFSVTVIDGQGCTSTAENIAVGTDCNDCDLIYTATSQDIMCGGDETGFAEIQTTEGYTYLWSNNATTNSISNLPPGEYSVTITEASTTCTAVETFLIDSPELTFVFETITSETCDGNDGTITLDVVGGTAPYTYAWTSDVSTTNVATGLTAGQYSVTVTDANACEDISNYEVLEDCNPDGCPNLVAAETGNAGTTDCDNPIGYCLDIPFSTVINWDITLNGTDYASSLIGCNFDTNFIYNYELVPDNGENGPYTMTSWMVNGSSQTGTFNNSTELVALMNDLDFFGQWSLDMATQTISGGLPGSSYGDMLVTQDASGSMGTLNVSSTFTPQGTQLLVNEGVNILVFTDENNCSDTLKVNGHCLTTETVEVTITEQQTDIFCADTAELPGDNVSVEFICGTCDNVGLALAEDGCIEYTGVAEGQDALTVIACDEFGVCDTTILIINVVPMQVIVNSPLVNDDFFTTPINVPVLLKVTENDIVMSNITDFGVQRTPNNGYIDINFDNTIMYTPVQDYCGSDLLTYYLCVGEDCASATTNIYVECDEPRPVSGFSPNGDGVNETFMIEGLEQFENNSLSIYDRRGITIYKTTNYKNDWAGKWRFNDVPDGTYFYVLRYEGGKMMSGYVQVMR